MAGYLWRERRRRQRKVVGILIIGVAATLALTWPLTSRRGTPSRLLEGLRPLATQQAVGQPMSDNQPRSSVGLRPLLPPTPTTQPAARPIATSHPVATPGSQLRPALPSSQPALSRKIVGGGLLAKVVSPVTQPATTLADGPQAAARLLEDALELRKADKLLDARVKLNAALHSGLTVAEAAQAREALADIANRTVFSKTVLQNDPLVRSYTVVSGDKLGRIAKRALVSEALLARINSLVRPDFLRERSRLKIVQGPFHASIAKRDHEMHLYLQHFYVGTLRVALGQDGSTPTGLWRVVNQLENPEWVDPRTGKRYHPDDPTNPLGEYWIGMEGLEGEATGQPGYGIHGTIEPETIGQDVSMGCIRLAADDIALVYRLLEPGLSYVVIYD